MKQAEPLERYVSGLLIATGVLYTVAAINTSVVFVREGYDYQALSGPLLLLGLLASFLALLGIYSKVRDREPILAKATGAVASLAVVAVTVLLAWGIASRVSTVSDPPAPLAIASLALFVTGFALAGTTVLRSSVYPRPVGYLLLGEAVALVVVIVGPLVVFEGAAPDEYTVGIELTQAVLLLLAGWLTRGDVEPRTQQATTGAKEA
jgi:hypothetical protein